MISASSNTCPATAVSTYAARSVIAKPPSSPACSMFGHHLDGDVRQARYAGEVGELRGHDLRRADAAAQRGLVHQEPRRRAARRG